jgi:hypothetical protein
VQQQCPYADFAVASAGGAGAGAGASSAGAGAASYGAAGAAHPGAAGAEAGAAQLGPFGPQAGAQAAGAAQLGPLGAHAGAQAAGAAQLGPFAAQAGLTLQQLAAGAAQDGFVEQSVGHLPRSSLGSFGRLNFGRHSLGSDMFGSLNPDGQLQSPALAGTA